MRVTGYYGKKHLHILIDSGSTHNFLDLHIAQKMDCQAEAMDIVSVTVADGNKVQISSKVPKFSWSIQNTNFTSDMILLPLGCCDLVLGIEWLVSLGDITWNFHKLTMEFFVHGKRHVLRGATPTNLATARKQHLHKTISYGVHLSMISLQSKVEGSLLHSLTTHANQ